MKRPHRALPKGLAPMAWIAASLFLLPLLGLLWRAPWSQFVAVMATREVLDALWLSLRCSVAAAGLCLLFGLPLAAWLAQGESWFHAVVRALVTLPMVLPPVVGGVALLLAFGRRGLVGAPLGDWFGITLPFHPAAVVLAETYIALPFFVLAVEAGLRSMDPRYGEAAATLGAGPWRVFGTVTLPLVRPSIRAGLLLAWARALGEFGATITFAGNLAGSTRSMPLAVYEAFQRSPDAAIVLSLVLMVVSALVLFTLRRRWFPS